jgi:hypothetical protein
VEVAVFDGELVCETADKVLRKDKGSDLEVLLVKDFDEK